MIIQMSSPFRDCIERALEEAVRRGDQRLGTDHLLLGALHDPRAREVVGADVPDARAALDRLDVAALASVGIETDTAPVGAPRRSRPRWSTGAQHVLRESVRDAKARRVKTIDVYSVLRSLLDRAAPDPVHDLLAQMGIEEAAVRARLEST